MPGVASNDQVAPQGLVGEHALERVGEGVDDLQPFAAADFARALAGLDA